MRRAHKLYSGCRDFYNNFQPPEQVLILRPCPVSFSLGLAGPDTVFQEPSELQNAYCDQATDLGDSPDPACRQVCCWPLVVAKGPCIAQSAKRTADSSGLLFGALALAVTTKQRTACTSLHPQHLCAISSTNPQKQRSFDTCALFPCGCK